MLRPTTYKKIISVRLYLRPAATNRQGLCPVRLTARWHGEELQVNTGELVLPRRVGRDGEVEELWHDGSQSVLEGRKLTEKEKGTVPTHPDTAININTRLSAFTKEVTDTFNRLYDLAPGQKLPKAAMVAELLPAAQPATPEPIPVKAAEARTFRQVLEEWKAENRNLGKDSLRKYDQLATMMESWQPDPRPTHVTQKVAKEYLQHLLDLQKSDATIKVHFTGLRKCFEQLGRRPMCRGCNTRPRTRRSWTWRLRRCAGSSGGGPRRSTWRRSGTGGCFSCSAGGGMKTLKSLTYASGLPLPWRMVARCPRCSTRKGKRVMKRRYRCHPSR
ncbi:hypothetical protein [Hymenobacter sp. BRD67]|uniref:hypothetical protein n=1 Tax=Hymenobacter sp. BRD67 TaxID=2675877 RepID=UPI001566AD5F|nr:hypothetical protein [Hymenobacter sp. BRD67]QKG54267.1 hypothetical protein GKZ67_18775 [Hymenobacter sp. BRD67]